VRPRPIKFKLHISAIRVMCRAEFWAGVRATASAAARSERGVMRSPSMSMSQCFRRRPANVLLAAATVFAVVLPPPMFGAQLSKEALEAIALGRALDWTRHRFT